MLTATESIEIVVLARMRQSQANEAQRCQPLGLEMEAQRPFKFQKLFTQQQRRQMTKLWKGETNLDTDVVAFVWHLKGGMPIPEGS